MKVLVDTNIIIDALTSRQPWNVAAEKLFIMAANHVADMYITVSSATDIYYLLRKHLQNTKETKQVMTKLFSLFNILDVPATTCIDALASDISDYEDAVLEQIAIHSRFNYIITRNIKDFSNSLIPTLLPDDFIRLIEQA